MAEVEYEARDANAGAVVKSAIAIAAVAILGEAVSFGTYVVLRNVHRANDPRPAPMAPRQGRVPPMPRLQSAPTLDLQQLRAEQMQRLTTYGWMNQQMGTVHIPIEDAMKLYVERAGTAPMSPVSSAAPPPAASPGASAPPGSPR